MSRPNRALALQMQLPARVAMKITAWTRLPKMLCRSSDPRGSRQWCQQQNRLPQPHVRATERHDVEFVRAVAAPPRDRRQHRSALFWKMRHLARLTGGLRHLLCHHVGDEKVPEGRRVTRPERLVSTAFASKRGTKVLREVVKGSRLGRILCHPCDGLRIQKLTIGRRLPMNGLSLQLCPPPQASSA